ncbi:MAG: hypothetical protein QGD88_02320 [Anaerolineae bacterium]|nr:hypothetical protein [Anaerolineae bacterium]
MVTFDKSTFEKFVLQLKRYASSESQLLSLILATSIFSCMLLYTLQRSYNPFVHDSHWYWSLADSFIANERFSLTNFHSELRGYFFPFLLFLIKSLASTLRIDDKTLFYVFSSLFFTVLSVYILPWFTNTLFGWKKHLIGKALIGLLLFFFWRGHFLYPLSDFPVFASLLIGVTLLTRSLQNPSNSILPVLAGFFLGAITNIRPIYQVSLFILFPSSLVFLWKSEKAQIVRWLMLFVLGISIVLFPQYHINKVHFQKGSPWVQAIYADENLYIKQLYWGLGTQKVGSNIGTNYPSGLVTYDDPFKLKLQKTNLLREKSLTRYFRIAQRFPVDMAISYFRHTFNGLDIFFPTPYIKNIYANHAFLSISNYLIWLLILIHLLKMDLSQVRSLNVIVIISLLSPVIFSIPTLVEVRFFLPAHLFAYGTIAFGINLKKLSILPIRNKWDLVRFLVIGSFWLLLCFTLSATTVENLNY